MKPLFAFYAQVFRYHRQALGLSQATLGKRLGIAHSTLSLIEKGQRKPSLMVLQALARLRNQSIETLVFQAFLS